MEKQPIVSDENKLDNVNIAGFEHEYDLTNPRETFNQLIKNAPPISPVDRAKAPFRDYVENTREQWKYVKSEEVESYLGEKFFFDTGLISHRDATNIFSIYAPSEERCIEVPLDLVVNGKGFEDWKGRDNKKNTKFWSSAYGGGDAKSLDVIKHYSGLSTKLPPVTQMLMFIQPNGKVFFDNCSGDSHRMAAAILRGFEKIETLGVDAYMLSKNYL